MAVDLSRLAGQGQQAGQQVLAGAQQLAGQSPLAGAVQEALSDFAQLHQQYQQPLQSTPIYQPSAAPDDDVLNQIGFLLAGMENHPVNTQGPDASSPITNGLADGQARHYSGAQGVLRGIWDNTVGQMVQQAQRNPASIPVMLGIGVGALAATALVPELAIPIWAGFALVSAPQILPQTIHSIADAAHNPTDANVTQALINIGTAGIAIGSPIKAFRGIGASRALLEEGTTTLETQDTLAGAARTTLGTVSERAAQPGERVGDVRELVDPTQGVEQFQVIPQTVDELEAEIAKRAPGQGPVDLDDGVVERLRNLLQVHGQLQRRVQEADPAGIEEGMTGLGDAVAGALPEAKRTLDAFEKDELIPAQKEFAHRYGYVLARENPMPRMTYEELNGVDIATRARVDRSFRAVWGILHGAGDGHGWDGESDGVVHSDLAANMAEAMARGMSGGGLEHAEAVLGTELMTAGRRLGVSDDRMEAVYRAIEGDRTVPSKEPDLAPGRVRLYRAGPLPGQVDRSGQPEWVRQGLEQSGAAAAQGRWFTEYPDELEWYARNEWPGRGRSYVDVPREEVAKYRADQLVAQGQLDPQISRRPDREHFLPVDLASQAKPYEMVSQTEHYWDALAPNEKYLASKLAVTFGIVTNYAYKHGHIELPLQRYVPRILRRGDVEYGRQGNAFLRSPGSIESRSWVADDWGVANDMLDEEHHPDEDVSLRPLADRLRQTVKTREQFQGGEDAKAQTFRQASTHRALLRDDSFANTLAETRMMVGQRVKDLIPKTQEKIETAAARISELERQIPDLDGRIREIDRALAPMKGKHGQQFQRQTLKDQQQDLIARLRPLTRELKKAREDHAGWTTNLAKWQREIEQAGQRLVDAAGGDLTARDLLGKSRDELANIAQGKHPGGRQLLTGYHLASTAFGRYLRQMNQTRYREAWQSLARTVNDSTIRKAYGAHAPISVQEINLMDDGEKPIVVPGDLPGGVPNAMLEGYVQVMPALGRDPGALNYQPAIYARADVAARYKELAQQARSASELKTSFNRGVYQLAVGIPKKFIMGSPAWHGKNVFGRYLTLLLDHPTLAASAMGRVLKERMLNPEAYYQTKLDHWMDGGVPANRHNVHEQMNQLEQQMTGQRTFLTAMRTPLGAIGHAHAKLAEGWFWKTVDDVGTAAYLVQKHRLMQKPWVSERVAGMLAAEHANNVAGMVNPLYMSKLWKYGRQMAMFAPSWWTSFARMAAQAVPGSARISHWMASHPRLSTLDPVKMHSLDIRQRKELVRMGRSYFLTYMAAGMAVHDMMNVILSGHHIWDNGKGREWDLQTDLSHKPQGDPETEQVKHAYMSGDLFFSQMADLMNTIGLGHDWGFLHQMQGDGYKEADTRHKLGMVGGALGLGLQQRAAGKVGLPVQEVVGLGLGVDPYRLLRSGEARNIPWTEALAGLLPGGMQAQVAMDDQRRLETRLRITGDPASLQQLRELQSQGELPGGVPWGPLRGAIKSQFMGLPSLYYAGDESPRGHTPLTEDQMQRYLQSRQDILSRKKLLSQQMLEGAVSPYDWIQQNQIQTNRYQQLLSDTFTSNSTQGQLWTAYDGLNKKYKLDDPNLTQGERISMLQARDDEWGRMLSSFSPNAQAVWWDAHTSMWTDADYLYYLSKQTKDAIAGSIDGEGGAHIRSRQHELSAKGLPLTTAAQQELRRQDPYLWTYYAVLSQMGKNTLLGALVSSFSNPFSTFTVIPDEQASQVAALEEAGVLKPGTFVRRSTMRGLAQFATTEGQAAAPEGGQFARTPAGQQLGRGLSAEEAAVILEDPKQTKGLDPRIIGLLEQIASGAS